MRRETLTTILVFLWTLLLTEAVRAATLSEFLGTYDQELIYFAALSAMLGGWIRTILSLQSNTHVVLKIVQESIWDTAKALISGMAVFFIIQAMRSAGYFVPTEVRFGAVVAAGWSRMAAVDWSVGLIKEWVAYKFRPPTDSPTRQPPDGTP